MLVEDATFINIYHYWRSEVHLLILKVAIVPLIKETMTWSVRFKDFGIFGTVDYDG
jgi:hypothetical protein